MRGSFLGFLLVAMLSAPSIATADSTTLSVATRAAPDSNNTVQLCRAIPGGSEQPIASMHCEDLITGFADGKAHAFAGHVDAFASVATEYFDPFTNGLTATMLASAVSNDYVVFSAINPQEYQLTTVQGAALNVIFNGTLNADESIFGHASASASSIYVLGDGFGNIIATTGDGVGPVTTHSSTPPGNFPLGVPIPFGLALYVSAGASGPRSTALADFSHSLELPTGTDVFTLPPGVTANAGNYIVNNRYIKPNASAPVPEPATWGLLASGLALLGGTRRLFKQRT